MTRLGPFARRGLMFLATVALWTTEASAAPPSRPAMIVLRGPEPATAQPPSADAVAPAIANQSIDPTPSPALARDWSTSPRVGGYTDAAGGGAQCRLSCAQDYYSCKAGQDDEDCGGHWSQCLTACPAQSADKAPSGY